MKKTTFSQSKKILSVLFTMFFAFSFAQNNYNIQFEDSTISLTENIDSFAWSQMPKNSKLNNGYYGWVQFYETPSQSVQNKFSSNGMELIEYISNKAYLFYFPESTSVGFLKNNGVRSIVAIPGEYKLSSKLKNPPYEDWAVQGNNILVTLQYYKHASTSYVIDELINKQIAVKQEYKGSNNIDLIIPKDCLESLSNLPFVKWVELIVAPSIPDDTRGRSLHRSNLLDTQRGAAGRDYTGENIGVMVRDDGIVGPHIDFEGRIDNSLASTNGPTHGDGVAGIMAGAGNLNPLMRGMAAGSNVYIVNYEPNFLDSQTLSLINNGSVQITNSSYSNGCNDGYTTITQTVDQQTNDNPSLLHVFSAGNSNNNDCGYGAGNQWGNITGGHKQGKNVIATANVFFDGSLVSSSSRGPAHDGRIKPDITANGQNQNSTDENNTYQEFGGTSGAAPGIAGVSAQLYEAYQTKNGSLPESALIKAVLLNSTNDYGNIGPDFKFGWGLVNALQAAKIIEEDRYLSAEATQGNTNSHTINVPVGTTQVRFMVYWSDSPAAPGAATALVNDLDLTVTNPSSTNYLPWILDPTPNPTTLNTPATNGVDHLNNVEQVLINNPAAGDYTVDISGFNVPVGPQKYYVVYELISENLTLTYPNASESFVPGEVESLHWDGVNVTEDYDLEYSIDNGTSWNAITTVSKNTTNYGWTVPNEVTGKALIRITSGAFQDTSDAVFSIARQASSLQITQVCPEEMTLAWTEVVNAESYDLYLLGEKYMEIVGTSSTNSITVPIVNSTLPRWAAVVARNDTEGWVSRRTIAINHPGGLINCSLANDVAIETNNSATDFNFICTPGPSIVSVKILNSGIDSQSNFEVSYQLDSEPVVSEIFTATLNSGQQAIYNFNEPLDIPDSGNYELTVSVNLTGDQNSDNNMDSLDFYAATEAVALDYSETFDVEGVPPTGWAILNADDSSTWIERSGITGSDGSSTIAPYVNNFDYNAAGQEDILETLNLDLTNETGVLLTFDLAKAQYSAGFSDGLRVEVSSDCGITFNVEYEKAGLDLSTLSGYTTSNFSPTSANNWRLETIDLGAYIGGNVVVRFINVTGYGNSTFIDNVNVSRILAVKDNVFSEVSLYPNPASNEVILKVSEAILGNISISVSNSLGQKIETFNSTIFSEGNSATIDVSSFAAGLYFITIDSGASSITKKLLIQ